MIKDESQSGGKIRRGRKKPYVKSTAHVVQERIEMVAELLAKGADSRTVRLTLQRAPHNLDFRSVPIYVSRARTWMLERVAGITKQHAIAEAINFYRVVIASKETDWREKLEARKQLDLIFGTHAARLAVIREIPLPQTPVDEMARLTNPAMEEALALVYGNDALNQVIEVESQRQLAAPTKRKQLPLA